MPSLPPLAIRLEQTRARNHLEWADEEVMKIGSQLMRVLKEIHDKKSYRFDYDSFEDYCIKKWKITRARAYQIIQGENFRALLAETGECQTVLDTLNSRQLAELSETTPLKAIKVLKRVAKSGKITAKKIAAIINPEVLPKSDPTCCPTCKRPYDDVELPD